MLDSRAVADKTSYRESGVNIDALLRAQIGLIVFAAAYLAEVIRGGLQAIPKGQYEAAEALGLTYWRKNRLIILPQALRIAIPPLVNTFIGFFKDTTLVIIVGLFDLLGAAREQPGALRHWLADARRSARRSRLTTRRPRGY
jgi:general L-amino acid transport system permease protein